MYSGHIMHLIIAQDLANGLRKIDTMKRFIIGNEFRRFNTEHIIRIHNEFPHI